ncbi:hypothetical protein D3C72_1281010 [compost metagenome]
MALQLQHVFAGKGVRAREPERDALIQRGAVCIFKRQIVGVARLWQFAQHGFCHLARLEAGDTQNAYTTASRWGCLGDDSVVMAHGMSLFKM